MEIKRAKGIVYVQARDEQFEVKKIDNEWIMIHVETQRAVTQYHKTQKSCLEAGEKEIYKLSDEKFKEMTDYARNCIKRKKYWLNPHIQSLFKRYFDRELNQFLDGTLFAFCDIYSLDVIKLDKIICPPNNMSTYDYVEKQHGKAARRLIRKLIGAEEE